MLEHEHEFTLVVHVGADEARTIRQPPDAPRCLKRRVHDFDRFAAEDKHGFRWRRPENILHQLGRDEKRPAPHQPGIRFSSSARRASESFCAASSSARRMRKSERAFSGMPRPIALRTATSVAG